MVAAISVKEEEMASTGIIFVACTNKRMAREAMRDKTDTNENATTVKRMLRGSTSKEGGANCPNMVRGARRN